MPRKIKASQHIGSMVGCGLCCIGPIRRMVQLAQAQQRVPEPFDLADWVREAHLNLYYRAMAHLIRNRFCFQSALKTDGSLHVLLLEAEPHWDETHRVVFDLATRLANLLGTLQRPIGDPPLDMDGSAFPLDGLTGFLRRLVFVSGGVPNVDEKQPHQYQQQQQQQSDLTTAGSEEDQFEDPSKESDMSSLDATLTSLFGSDIGLKSYSREAAVISIPALHNREFVSGFSRVLDELESYLPWRRRCQRS